MEKIYNLEDRTYQFAKNCRIYIKSLPKTISNLEDCKQLVRSSGSVGANYIEANKKLGDKDFAYRLKISRKEAKETRYWLKLLHDLNPQFSMQSEALLIEVEELRKILSTIINKI